MKPQPAKGCPVCAERYEGDVLFCPKDGTPLTNTRSASFQTTSDGDPYLGIELAGQIRLKALIGIGSMGRVYRAFQAGIDRDVAVKILHRELAGNAELVQRFHREAKVASRLVHPNVVQVLMTGTVPFRTDPRVGGELYLVMEHLDGISLLSALAAAGGTKEGAALPLPRALHIVLQLCDAVGEAHAQGIVHRDLKPENVMLIRRVDDPDFVKVLDFGIARIDWANQSIATQAGLIFGTAKYISPEGAGGESVGPPADVYSIATILYQCLAGRAPFEDESPVQLLVQHTHAPPPELRSVARASYVPAPIAEVVMQNLAKKPAARAQEARAFGRDLIAAIRASGLDPEEIIAHTTLLMRGAMRVASYARTKSMDMTPELQQAIATANKAPPPAPPPPPIDPSLDRGSFAGLRPSETMVVDANELMDMGPLPVLPAPPLPQASGTATSAATPAAAMPPTIPPPLPPQGSITKSSEIQGDSKGLGAEATQATGAPSVEKGIAQATPEIEAPSPAPIEPPSAADQTMREALQPHIVEGAAPEAAPASAPAEGAGTQTAPEPAKDATSEATAPPPDRLSSPQIPRRGGPTAVVEMQPSLVAPPALPEPPPLDRASRPVDVALAAGPAPQAAADPPPSVVAVPPPAIQTLFDAPVPAAVTGAPPDVGSAPVSPSRPGATQVGGGDMDLLPASAGLDVASGSLRGPASGDSLRASSPMEPMPVSIPIATRASEIPGPSLRTRADHRRWPRAFAIVAAIAAVALVAVVGSSYMSRGPTPIEAASSDELLERARDAMRNRAWDSPPGENVKELTAAALEKSPEDHRIRDLRDEAAEKILTEAVGKKYSGDRAEALRLAKLALELGSDHVAAQGLVAELDAPAAVASVPATAETGEPARTVAGPTKAGPGGARTSKTGLPPPARSNTSAVAPAGPSGKPKPTGTPSSTNAAQLPPAPPGGPWL